MENANAVEIKCKDFNKRMPSNLHSFLNNKFCDVYLSAGGRVIAAHQNILAASSPYLEEVFDVKPGTHHTVIFPKNIKFESLENVLEFIYLGEVVVDVEQVEDFKKAAEYLQINHNMNGQDCSPKNETLSWKQNASDKASDEEFLGNADSISNDIHWFADEDSNTAAVEISDDEAKTEVKKEQQSARNFFKDPLASLITQVPSFKYNKMKLEPKLGTWKRNADQMAPVYLSTNGESAKKLKIGKVKRTSQTCKFCQKAIIGGYHRKRHEDSCKMNPNPMTFECPHCDKVYTRKDKLNAHIKNFHSQSSSNETTAADS